VYDLGVQVYTLAGVQHTPPLEKLKDGQLILEQKAMECCAINRMSAPKELRRKGNVNYRASRCLEQPGYQAIGGTRVGADRRCHQQRQML
jgi:hypothetical protein